VQQLAVALVLLVGERHAFLWDCSIGNGIRRRAVMQYTLRLENKSPARKNGVTLAL
jgi:hypothetical protein